MARLLAGERADVRLRNRPDGIELTRRRLFARVSRAGAGVELLLALGGVGKIDRFEEVDGFSTPITHRLRIDRVQDVDATVLSWVERAWELA
ncbi:MAG: DUF5655 domain-containing protein [Acidobacteriota bacterium]